ncbi:unnamed protein product [Caenorhabditis nigoni]
MTLITSTSSVAVPIKKSRRLQQKSGCVEKENIQETTSIPVVTAKTRGTEIPIGLGHTPFPFNEQVSLKAIREQKKLELKIAPKAKDNSVKVGEEHQADLPEFNPKLDDNDDQDREEVMWRPSPKTFHDHESYQAAYFLPIWYQFKGQIPFDVALQNLMSHDYDIGKALETIDEKLKILPQKFKNLTKIQMRKFNELYDTKNKQGGRVEIPTRKYQEKAMRNYHISEVQHFYHLFENQSLQGSCACPVLAHPEVVPRWACCNCTKHLKPTTSKDECLICLNYKAVTGTTRPANDPVFTDEELQKILNWQKVEEQAEKPVSKEEFERIQKQSKIDRFLRNELTEEERLIVEPGQLPHKKKNLTEAQKQENGWNLVEQLEECPLGLPEFRQCSCEARNHVNENSVPVEIRKAVKRKSVDEEKQVQNSNAAKKPRRVLKRL